jgi:Cu(I)/Ag(I) efflux system membrane protein CusA/SilA
MIRGLGYLHSLSDLETVPVATKNGTPVLVRDLGTVTFGPDIREGVAEWQGEGETVGGIVVMRDGMNALAVIDGVKEKLAEIKPSLPPGVEVVSGYDRSGLIHASIQTLQRDLLEEAAIVSVVTIIFLFHFRSALIPILTLPIAVLAAFIPMYYLHVTSNIMSLGGLALAIGVLVDAAIVMVENGYRQLSEHQTSQSQPLPEPQRRKILLDSAKQVGPAIFFSLVIIVVSFLPVFLLEAQEGRMFRPLAWTKTLAVGFSSVLAITLVPVLMILFIRGRLIPESRNPCGSAKLPCCSIWFFWSSHFRSHFTLEVNSCLRSLKVRRSTCRQPCPESPSGRRPNYSKNRIESFVHSRKSRPSSVPSGDPTARLTMLPSICMTPRSCSSHAVNGGRE